jgi:hypothetical protein
MIDQSGGFWKTRFDSRGEPFQVWQKLPYIDPEYLDCTIYLYPSEAAAEDGARIGGTGFLIGIPVGQDSGESVVAIVTNRHVVAGGNTIARLNTKSGSIALLPLDNADWFDHPDGDDLSICPISLPLGIKNKYLPIGLFLRKDHIEQWDIGPGDDVFVVGRFVNHEGRLRNIPSLRFGNIAQMPWEPIMSDGYPQESFLVECRSISGYSGSPVFVWITPPNLPGLTKDGREHLLSGKFKMFGVSLKRARNAGTHGFPAIGPFLLGINYCYLRSQEPVRSASGQEMHDWFVNANTGMMGVIPSWRLNDIIDGVEMKRLKEKVEADMAKRKADSAIELTAAIAKDDLRDPQETEIIRDAALAKALRTPPKPKTKPDAV